MIQECREDREFLAFLKKERRRGACSVALWIAILAAILALTAWGTILACDKIMEVVAPAAIGIMP